MASWPDFSPLTLAETAYRFILRQAFFRKIKDDLDNLNGRVGQVEGGLTLLDHFASIDQRFNTINTNDIEDQVGHFYGVRDFSGAGAALPALWTFPANSVVRIAATQPAGAASGKNVLFTIPRYIFNNLTRPLIYEARVKWRGVSSPLHWFGMSDAVPAIGNYPNAGVYLAFPNSTDMRFQCRDGTTTTNGTGFARVAADTWFTVKIEFTDTPSNRALCYIDGVLKETLTTNLPTSQGLFGAIDVQVQSSATTTESDCDRLKFSPIALADAA